MSALPHIYIGRTPWRTPTMPTRAHLTFGCERRAIYIYIYMKFNFSAKETREAGLCRAALLEVLQRRRRRRRRRRVEVPTARRRRRRRRKRRQVLVDVKVARAPAASERVRPAAALLRQRQPPAAVQRRGAPSAVLDEAAALPVAAVAARRSAEFEEREQPGTCGDRESQRRSCNLAAKRAIRRLAPHAVERRVEHRRGRRHGTQVL